MAMVADLGGFTANSYGSLPASMQVPAMPSSLAYIPPPPVSSPLVANPPETMPLAPPSTRFGQPPYSMGGYPPSSGVQGGFPSIGSMVPRSMPVQSRASQSEAQWRAEREELINLVNSQERMIEERRELARRMPLRNAPVDPQLLRRLEDIEAKLLASKLVPMANSQELIPPANLPNPNRVPNGLLEEFWHRTTVEDNPGDDGDDDDDQEQEDVDEYEQKEQEELERLSKQLGLPALAQLGLPKDAKIVDIRQVEAPDMPEYRMLPFVPEQQRQQLQQPALQPQPVLRGRVYDSNYALVPSPYHPRGPMSKMVVNGKPLVSNLYPIDRAPMKYEDCFANPVPGAPRFFPAEKAYKAHADFYEARRFQQPFCEISWDRDADRGAAVRNVKYRTTPAQDPIAAQAVDVSGDGFADVVVVGVDRNNDGIPDALQVNPVERVVTKTLSAIFPY